MKKYDYLIVGAGLYGAMFAYNAKKNGKSCLVIDKNNHVGGYCYSTNIRGIEVHMLGAHIFRTDSKKVWDFVNSICEFEPFINSPLASYEGELYNLPFNMNTFKQVFGVKTPAEAKKLLSDLAGEDCNENLEKYAIGLVGEKMYKLFIKDYTEKQWGKKCSELPWTIMKRIPLRFTYDNNYFREKYQGIPSIGYTGFIEKLLEGCDVIIGEDYFENRNSFNEFADKIVYTGAIDEFYDYRFGKLEWRSVRFEHRIMEIEDYQGNAVINYTDKTPYTRVIEHKHFMKQDSNVTVVSFEYPAECSESNPPSYPIETRRNIEIYKRYKELSEKEPNIIFGGRLGEYKYYSMNDIIEKFV